MTVVLTPPNRYWKCASCGLSDVTQRADIHTQMHPCPALMGVSIPLEEVSSPDATPVSRHVAVEREDYIGDELGAGRYMAIRTDRPDGSNDIAVLAPTAAAKAS
jgi:hypothetical protein